MNKLSKLSTLKKTLTLNEAVSNISKAIEEDISIRDLYQLALDGHLIMSVNFVNQAYAIKGKYSLQNELILESNVHPISGIWDLTMKGQEALEIKQYYETINSGKNVTTLSGNGILLSQGEVICQLYKYFDKYKVFNPKYNESEERKKEIAKEPMRALENNPIIVKPLIRKDKGGLEFVPSKCLSYENCVLVIRTDEVIRFIQSMESTPQEVKPLVSNERNSLLVLIAALCKEAKVDYGQRGISTSLVKMTELNGASLTDDTIRKILKQIEPAISVRSN